MAQVSASISAFRLVRAPYAGRALDGEGARRLGGRWNAPGTPVVYCAASRALAVLEALVHLHRTSRLHDFRFVEVGFAPGDVETVELGELPADWRASPAPAVLRGRGEAWARAGRTPVLAVPSVVVPEERNYLLNPRHPGFDGLRRSAPVPFELDPRLVVAPEPRGA